MARHIVIEEGQALRDELMANRNLATDFSGALAAREAKESIEAVMDFAQQWDAMASAAREEAELWGINQSRSFLAQLGRAALGDADGLEAASLVRGLALGIRPRILLDGVKRRSAA